MSQQPPVPAGQPHDFAADRLDSWKDIAAHLKRDVSTVQRWEKREGMPVHRHVHDKLSSVYAFRSELDAWWQSRSNGPAGSPTPVEGVPVATSTASVGGDDTDLESTSHAPSAVLSDGSVGARVRSRRAWLAAAAAVATVVAGVWLLERADYFWQSPLSAARFHQLTDFEGTEHAAAISRDGRFIAFLADRDGQVDIWMTQVGTGQFHNLTRGRVRELVNPDVRTIGFSPDSTLVTMWVRGSGATTPADISVWAIPVLGGEPRPYLESVAEFDWSSDGTRLVYHTPDPGDPTFVKDGATRAPRQIWVAPSGLHAHFPVWSADGAFVYFVHGAVPDQMDIWRMRPSGGRPERITFHNSRVTHPTFLDRRTLLYLATAADGSGPWLFALDTTRRKSHRLSSGVERYTSVAASADGRRLVLTVANPTGTIWRVPIAAGVVNESTARRIIVPTTGGRSPRYAADSLLYVSARGDSEGIWKLANDTATELWSSPGARIIGGPAVASDGRVAFSAEQDGQARLYVMNGDGSAARELAAPLAPRGAPAWAPDGQSIVVASHAEGEPRVVRVSMDDESVAPLVSDYSLEPVWSPGGETLVYSGPDIGTTFQVSAVRAAGGTHPPVNLTLSRGARRLGFLPGRSALIVLRGEINHKNFWLIDLDSGAERHLTSFGRQFVIRDFDVSADGREIVFDQLAENSDIVMIDR